MNPEEIEHRLIKAEENIEDLFGRTNRFNQEMATVIAKLDNMLVTLGELKATVTLLQNRPVEKWDKLIFAIIGAAGSALVSYLLK
ncbi:MAG: hypothetical protein IKK85_03575 [Clostridia bacterium]|nr:hypothetical protein [Clostridia bacterium]